MPNQRKHDVGPALISLLVFFLMLGTTAYGLDGIGALDSFHEWAAQAVIHMNPTMAESNDWF
jgi:hypothetical protein